MKNKLFLHIIIGICYLTLNLNAVSLKDTIIKVMNDNPNIQAQLQNEQAYKKYVDDAQGNYLPTIDLETSLQSGKENEDRKSSTTDGEWQRVDGYTAAIVFRQYLYDGGITPSQVSQSRHEELANRYRNFDEIEKTVLQTVSVYSELVKSDERLNLTKKMVETNEENMITAKENEKISGEVLETYQVASKLHFVADKYIDEEDKKDTAVASYIRYVGSPPKGRTCRPVLDDTKIPQRLEEAIRIAILNNYRILEQIERIKVQREKIAQTKGAFLPKLNLELRASVDNDLDLSEDGTTKDIYGRLNLNWNLFNGNKDNVATQQEKLFLNEQKKILDDITYEIVGEIRTLHSRHQKYEARKIELEKYVKANVNIVDVYKDQFLSGTRTFIDILNAQSELFESIKALIDLEYVSINNYYELMYYLSSLSENILSSKNQICENIEPRIIEFTAKKQNKNTQSELNDLISDMDSSLIESFNLTQIENEDNSNESINSLTNEEDSSIIEIKKKELMLEEPLNDSEKESLQNELSSLDNENITKTDNMLLSASEDNFTINLATFSSIQRAQKFILDNNLGDKAFIYEFGKDEKHVKVIYGIYKTSKEADIDMGKFDEKLLRNRPFINRVKKHQELYNKYN